MARSFGKTDIDYLRKENRVLREQLGKRRLRLSDEQRARLAAGAAALGRSLLESIATIATPDTLLRFVVRIVTRPRKTVPNPRNGFRSSIALRTQSSTFARKLASAGGEPITLESLAADGRPPVCTRGANPATEARINDLELAVSKQPASAQ